MDREGLPDVLYKFRPLASDDDWVRLEQILTARELWFSSVDKFNDPFEGLPVLSTAPTTFKRALDWAKRKYSEFNYTDRQQRRKGQQHVARGLRRGLSHSGRIPEIDGVGICCLMTRVDSLLAWSHYSARHRGVALGFRVAPVTSEHPIGNMFSFALPVKYADRRPSSDVVRDDNESRFSNLFLTSAKCWEYEHEWRLLVDPNVPESQVYCRRANSPALFDVIDLVEVRFGSRLAEKDQYRVRQMLRCTGANPALSVAKTHSTEYGLTFRAL